MGESNTLLNVAGLTVWFQAEGERSWAVNSASFTVGRGETVCLVGESGCGKTVSALSIMGLVKTPPGRIAAGKVMFEGKNLLSLSDAEMQQIRGRRIAMVFQEPLASLNPVFTIGDQISEAITVHERLAPGARRAKVLELLRAVGIPSPDERLGSYPHQLSGGQRQRVMIAMALACEPDLIIADEPTTALDVTIQAQILNLLKSIKEDRGLSLLYITHDLGVVASIADRVYVMYAGCVVEQGEVGEVFLEPRHPYTKGLLASLPDRARRGMPLTGIPGYVPGRFGRPVGCPFAMRCSEAEKECHIEFPQFLDWGKGHMARCPALYSREKRR
jgi:oligopeptide/dipeptide ABC transporter ATP-binding protein